MTDPLPSPDPAPAEPTAAAAGSPTLRIPFKAIFWSVVVFTAAFWLGFIVLPVFGPHDEQAKSAAETLPNVGLSGIVTIFGLAGGP